MAASLGEPARGSQFRLTLPQRAGDELTSSPITLVPDDVIPDAAIDGVGAPYRQTGRRPAGAGIEAGTPPSSPTGARAGTGANSDGSTEAGRRG